MGENSLCVDQAMFEHYKMFCMLYGCSNVSAIDCTDDPHRINFKKPGAHRPAQAWFNKMEKVDGFTVIFDGFQLSQMANNFQI